jgi:chromate transport protein ChrA
VRQTGWLRGNEGLVAVTVSMPSPESAVVTAIFVGFRLCLRRFPEIAPLAYPDFLPSFVHIPTVAHLPVRYRADPNTASFVKGAYAAAIEKILGAYVLIGKIAIGDFSTELIAACNLSAS